MVAYTSPLLSHFVGTTDAHKEPIDLEAQYDRLVRILRSCCLSAFARLDPSYKCNPGYPSLQLTPNASFSADELYWQACVCFCDIPADSLSIHRTKYGQFGIAFQKEYLVAKGASPAFYVATNSLALYGMDRGRYFDARLAQYVQLRNLVNENRARLMARADTAEIAHLFGYVSSFLDFMIFGFLKPFDASLPDDARTNSYMEREWRVLGDVAFTLADVGAIYVAPGFAPRIRVEFPELGDRVNSYPNETDNSAT